MQLKAAVSSGLLAVCALLQPPKPADIALTDTCAAECSSVEWAARCERVVAARKHATITITNTRAVECGSVEWAARGARFVAAIPKFATINIADARASECGIVEWTARCESFVAATRKPGTAKVTDTRAIECSSALACRVAPRTLVAGLRMVNAQIRAAIAKLQESHVCNIAGLVAARQHVDTTQRGDMIKFHKGYVYMDDIVGASCAPVVLRGVDLLR